jgi:copper(I)-binding protein
MNHRHFVFATLLACLGAAAHAEVTAKDAWVRATVPAQRATGAFMQLNATENVRVVEVRSPVAKIVELHEMRMDGDKMMMQALPWLDLTPSKPVDLKPGGYHVMLIDLLKPLSAGDKVPLTLVVEGKDKKRSSVEISAEVRGINGKPLMDHQH